MSIKMHRLTVGEIFVFLTVISLTVFVIKYFGIKPQYRTIRVEVIKKGWTENYDPYGYRAPFWLSDKIKVGQTEKDINTGKPIATLVNMENYIRGGEEADIYLTLKVKVTQNLRNGKYLYKDLPLDVGSDILLNLNNIVIPGQITDNDVPQNGYPTKYFIVTTIGRNVEEWIASQIVTGLTMNNRANNDTIVQILDVKTQEPLYQIIKSDHSRLITTTSSNKDIILTMKIKAQQIDNRWYFGGHQNLKVGNDIYISPNNATIHVTTVQKMEELPN